MKKLIIILTVLLAMFTLAGKAQMKVKQDAQGNFIPVKDSLANCIKTDQLYIDDRDNLKYNVYKSKNGKWFIFRTSKNTGKQYRQYLKVDTY